MKKIMLFTFVFVLPLTLFLVSCATSPPEIRNVEVTRIIEITTEPEIVIEVVEVTRIVEIPVTVTPTNTPQYTPTITSIPTETPIPTSTPNPLTESRGSGFYLVGIDIAPGTWRSEAGYDGCYWSINTEKDDIINNHFGMSGGTAYISASAFIVEFSDCGIWTYLGP